MSQSLLRVNKLLETGIFEPWPLYQYPRGFQLSQWVRVKGTPLFYLSKPSQEPNTRWYYFPRWKEHLRGSYSFESKVAAKMNETTEINLEHHLKPHIEKLKLRFSTSKGFLDITTGDLIELLPEELQMQFLFNIDLFSGGS